MQKRRRIITHGTAATVLCLAVLPMPSANGASKAAAACGTVTIPAKTLGPLYPSLRAGDRDFRSHGPAVMVSAKLKIWRTYEKGRIKYSTVLVRLTMRAEETRSNWTKAEGSREFRLYRKYGCAIKDVSYGDFDANGYLDRSSRNPQTLPAGDSDRINRSFVNNYTVWDNRRGADVGHYTRATVTTRPMKVYFYR